MGAPCKKAHAGHLVCTVWAGARPYPSPCAGSLHSPPERMAGTRLPVLEQQNWCNQACTPTPCFNLLSFECQTPNSELHVQRCCAGFTQETADRRKHFWAVWVVPAKLILMAMCNSERNVPSPIYTEIIIDVYNHIMETCRDQHKLMQTVGLFWYRRKVHLSSTSPVLLILTVPKSTCPGQSAHGQELLIFSTCKVPVPSSLCSYLVMEADNTASQPKAWQAQNLLLQDSFCGSCYWLNILWIFHVLSRWEKTFSDFLYWLWKAKTQLFVLTWHHNFF